MKTPAALQKRVTGNGAGKAARLGSLVIAAGVLAACQADEFGAGPKHLRPVSDSIKRVFDWGGVGGIEAEEFLVFPGMEELFALLEVNDHARSGATNRRQRS